MSDGFFLRYAVDLGSRGSAYTIEQDLIRDLLIGAKSFVLDFDITPAAGGQTGEILRFGTSFIVSVRGDGELRIRAETTDPDLAELVTFGAGFDTTGAKSVALTLADGILSARVDGSGVGQVALPSPVTVKGWDAHDFHIGNPWSNANYDATLSSLSLSAPPPAAGSATETHAAPGGGATYVVGDLSGLLAVLAEVSGGETILLEAGDYGRLELNDKAGIDRAFAADVIIASRDPAQPARLTGLEVRDAAHLVFEDLVFDYTFSAAHPIHERPFAILDSSAVTIRGALFDGDIAWGVSDIDDGHGWGIGLTVRNGRDVRIEGSEFRDFWRGAMITDSDGVTVRGNEVHRMRMDGFDFAAVTDVLIEDNLIHSFDRAWGATDHADMIQFWTNGTDRPSSDIVIRGNHLDIGAGGHTQSVFMRNDVVDRGLAGPAMFYRNVTIEDNVIVNGHQHGITVGESDGLTIRGNTVLHADGGDPDGPDASVEIPQINVAGTARAVVVEGNITGGAAGGVAGWRGQADWTVAGNVVVQDQDPDAPGHYTHAFVSTSLDIEDGLHRFQARPGGLIDTLGAGASGTHAPGPALVPAFHVLDRPEDAAARYLDARHSTLDSGPLPDGTRYHWTFGDGASVEGGPLVRRDYASGAAERVTLEVTLPDGRSAATSYAFEVDGPDMLDFAAGGLFVADDGTVYDAGARMTAAGLHLGDPGTGLAIDRRHVSDLVGAEEFRIAFGLDALARDSDGEVFRFGTALTATVTETGELQVLADTDEGFVRLTSQGAGLNDTEVHAVELSLMEGRLRAVVDGEERGDVAMATGLADTGRHGLYFGNPWDKENFEGVLTFFEMSHDASDFDARAALTSALVTEADGLALGF